MTTLPIKQHKHYPLIETLHARYGGEVDGLWLKAATIKGQLTDLYVTGKEGGEIVVSKTEGNYNTKELSLYLGIDFDLPLATFAKRAADPHANDNRPPPIDLWQRAKCPPLTVEYLPEVIGEFASIQADLMGADPAGLAMAALATCAAAIPDSIEIQPKEHDPSWRESARLWVALVGLPSTMKSPIINAATRPLKALDKTLYQQFAEAKAAYDDLDKDAKKSASVPRHTRLRLEDTTIEAAQEVLKDSPDGVLLLQDELSGWFGSMEKYSGGGRGSAKDRGFWLQAFNGGPYTINRVGRGASMIPNLSCSLLGGIQPEPIRAIAKEMQDDGLLQRLFPIILRAGKLGKDVPMPDVVGEYGALVDRLHVLRKPLRGGMQEVPLRFSPAAQRVWQEVAERNHDLATAWESVNVKLAAHCGKFNGMFARLCLVWHCIESKSARPASVINEDVATRVRDFLYEFLYPHAIAFYTDVVGLAERQDAVLATAGYILAKGLHRITLRDMARGDSIMRALDVTQAEAVMVQLDALGWLTPVPSLRRDSREWSVDTRVFEIYSERAEEEKERRKKTREIIRDALKVA
ncbi:DUF3987 domain-containing protein [Ciceribacter sp. L1K22]|uniref:DUF3987 domain-containing protein n=1 Tax=Ciceribacter sp. L1K22 TaxID=2820275 RepID=UPI001ABEDCAA|nr:DUF3987 domain-containing protein [Ciceribacter sp. L1K22]MBO3760034.1 DUF3987 domain-containing protein [Ciceribacter sp. L1K22]